MTGAEARVLLGMAFGAVWGIGISQWVKAAYYGTPVLPWILLAVVGTVGVVVTERFARHGGRFRRRQ